MTRLSPQPWTFTALPLVEEHLIVLIEFPQLLAATTWRRDSWVWWWRVHPEFNTSLKEILCSHYDGTLTFSLEAHNREMDLIQTYIESNVLWWISDTLVTNRPEVVLASCCLITWPEEVSRLVPHSSWPCQSLTPVQLWARCQCVEH